MLPKDLSLIRNVFTIVSLTFMITTSFNTFSQAPLVVRRWQLPPDNQWFTFSGRKQSGVIIYNGTPNQVKEELYRVLSYYRIDTDTLTLTDGIMEFEYTVNKTYTLFIYLSEVDLFEWNRSVYLRIIR